MAPRSETYKQDPDYIKLNNFQKAIYWYVDGLLPAKLKDTLDTDLIGSSKKTFYISGWSFAHMIFGLIIGYFILQFWHPVESYYIILFTLHTAYEVISALAGVAPLIRLTGRSNIVDTVVDTVMFMGGAYLAQVAYRISKR